MHHRRRASAQLSAQVPEGIEPTRLYPLNKDVDGMNQGLLSALPGNTREFKAVDKGTAFAVANLC